MSRYEPVPPFKYINRICRKDQAAAFIPAELGDFSTKSKTKEIFNRDMKHILFLTPQLPFPPISGGVILSWRNIQYLSKNYKLDVISLLKGGDLANEKEFLTRIQLNEYNSFPVNEIRYRRNALNLARSYFSGVPLSIFRNQLPELNNFIAARAVKYDCIIVDNFLMFQFIPEGYKGKVLLHQQNAEYVMWDRVSRSKKSPLTKILMRIESRRILNYELLICDKADCVLCVAENDIDALVRIGVDASKIRLIMTSGEASNFTEADLNFDNTEEALLYIGTLSWEPNIDGLTWFIEGAWSAIRNLHPAIKLYIVGKDPPDSLRRLAEKNEGIVLTGFVESLESYYTKCRVFISPLRYGSGIKLKNLNAMSRGIPVVTTPVGIEGIEAQDLRHFALASNLGEFVTQIDMLISDRQTWSRLSQNSRELMRSRCVFERVFGELDRAING